MGLLSEYLVLLYKYFGYAYDMEEIKVAMEENRINYGRKVGQIEYDYCRNIQCYCKNILSMPNVRKEVK